MLVIAEIGINHNGELEKAMKMVAMAAYAGWDCVKLQKRTPTLAVPMSEWDKPKSTPWGTMTYLEYKHRIEFDQKQHEALYMYWGI